MPRNPTAHPATRAADGCHGATRRTLLAAVNCICAAGTTTSSACVRVTSLAAELRQLSYYPIGFDLRDDEQRM